MYGMDLSIKQQIEELEVWRQQSFRSLPPVSFGPSDSQMRLALYSNYRHRLAGIVVEAGSLMTDVEKLNHLIGDSLYPERKEIIQSMIDTQHIDPNAIVYQVHANPLYESVMQQDVPFTQYLLGKNATPNKKTLKRMNNNPEFMALLKLENKIVMKIENDNDTLIKELEKLNKEWQPTMEQISLDASTIMGLAEAYHQQRQCIINKYKVQDSNNLPTPFWYSVD